MESLISKSSSPLCSFVSTAILLARLIFARSSVLLVRLHFRFSQHASFLFLCFFARPAVLQFFLFEAQVYCIFSSVLPEIGLLDKLVSLIITQDNLTKELTKELVSLLVLIHGFVYPMKSSIDLCDFICVDSILNDFSLLRQFFICARLCLSLAILV